MLREVGHGREESRLPAPFSNKILPGPIISHKDPDIGSPLPLRFTQLKVPDSCCFLACRIALRWRCDFQDGEEAP